MARSYSTAPPWMNEVQSGHRSHTQKPCSEPLLSLNFVVFNNCLSALEPYSY
jgi:hypothetical protein